MGGLIYIIRPINLKRKKLLKLGYSADFNKRLNTYNTTVPDNVEVLFTLEVTNYKAVELYIKKLMKPFVYRKNKEYYECSLARLRKMVLKCDALIKNELYCDHCQNKLNSFTDLIDHAKNEHETDEYENLFLDVGDDDDKKDNFQKGGTIQNPINPEEMLDTNDYLSGTENMVLKGGGFKCPNGVIMTYTGKVIDPDERPDSYWSEINAIKSKERINFNSTRTHV